MTEFLASANLSGLSDFVGTASAVSSPASASTFTAAGFQITRHESGYYNVGKYVGNETVPGDIKRLRRSIYEMLRRFGQPFLVKHMWNDADVDAGIAQPSPNFDDIYGQTRMADPFSWGTGFCSIELSTDEYIRPDGSIVTLSAPPTDPWPLAPKYRGFGPGYLIYMIEPDAAEDFFKLSPTGALIEVQTANAVAPWYPLINDNDLLIMVELDDSGRIYSTGDRFQAKLTNPVTIRGLDRKGRGSNRHLVNQMFPMTRVPENNVLQRVEADR